MKEFFLVRFLLFFSLIALVNCSDGPEIKETPIDLPKNIFHSTKPQKTLLSPKELNDSLKADFQHFQSNDDYHHLNKQEDHHQKRQKRQFYFLSTALSSNVSNDDQNKDSGLWAPWSDLSECTRSCGGGVNYQTRVCQDINRACSGPAKRYFSCNTQECPPGTENFRLNQCSRFDQIPFDGRYYHWIPYYKAANPCELNCKPENERFYYRHARKVIDGTRCYDDESNNICVDGICVELGCDRILGSNLKEDKCRVCGGDGSSCRQVSGVYEQTQGLKTGYNDILWIPAGSTNIKIREVQASNNYLAIRNQYGQFYLNGNWRIEPPSSYEVAGTKFHYERPHGTVNRVNFPETLRALGPTSEPLFLMLLYQEPNQGISYEYSVPLTIQYETPESSGKHDSRYLPPQYPSPQQTQQGVDLPRYSWVFGDFTNCTRSCGTGIQKRNVFCASINTKNRRQTKVAESLCDSALRPSDTRPCNNDPCPASWHTSQWSPCSCTLNIQQRNVYCSSSGNETMSEEISSVMLPDFQCMNGTVKKPDAIQKCEADLSRCPQWITTEWTKCDVHCGLGRQNRTVKCGFLRIKKNETVEKNQQIDVELKKVSSFNEDVPTTETVLSISNTNAKLNEISTEATLIDNVIPTTISSLIKVETNEPIIQPQKRETSIDEELYDFVDDFLCEQDSKPVAERSCSNSPCDENGSIEWIVSSWSSCDTDCSSTVQTRQVLCSTRNGTIYPNETCVMLRGPRPTEQQMCAEAFTCSRSLWFTSEWSACSVSCGNGLKTRQIFCGTINDKGMVVKDTDDLKCDSKTKPTNTTVCKNPDCPGVWFSAPLGSCSMPCGGGKRKRKQFCLKQNSTEFSTSDKCEEKTLGSTTKIEQCNVQACNEDQLALIANCKEQGCCPNDNSTDSEENCPFITATEKDSCESSEFGCCPNEDDDSEKFSAFGPFGLGCPIRCHNTKYGCCSDLITVANLSDHSDCPPIPCEECDLTTTTTITPTTTVQDELIVTENIKYSNIPLANLSKLAPNCSNEEEGSGDSDCVATELITVKDCAKSRFGCCPDGWSEAAGPNQDGCDEGSGDDVSPFVTPIIPTAKDTLTTLIDLVTSPSTTYPSVECILSEFGCCPNGQTKAIGPNFYGCTCHDYPFKCCQDNYTPASGPNYEGCLCERMAYGCCPDGQTPATGPDQKGCNCETSPYSCCPDMITTAQGPNYQGCPCDTLVYGCCPNSNTPARGPGFSGCSCADTPFGCCADGITVALGPKFEGCPSGPSLDLKLSSEVCGLPMEVGPCRNFSVKWFFDVKYGGCNRFWYGGCEGNGNRFISQELCERSCVKPEGPERCLLPKIRGQCNTTKEMYFFDSKTRQCQQFWYDGCLGNSNRFESIEQCQQTCMYEEKALDMCDQPMSQGSCRGYFKRWYYRREEGRCSEFVYSGCQGNLNNFQTETECQSSCASKTPFEICMLPKAQGPCLGAFPRWYFDSSSGVCRDFIYSGCEGNKNRFVDRTSCERLCNQTLYSYPNLIQPSPPPFDNEITSYENVCALPKAVGPCPGSILQWYFDSAAGRCDRFFFSGCGGNVNRFNDQETCERTCSHTRPLINQDPCLEQKDAGSSSCSDYRERWFFDVEDRRCHRFYYSGCGGNHNNFNSLDECSNRCERPREVSSTTDQSAMIDYSEFRHEFCFKQFDVGGCEKTFYRWYYDRADGVCKEFIFGGCGGNENRFQSQHECQTKCWNSQDICKLPYIRGGCSYNFTQWYFDYNTNQCHEFQYSGCEGNANRFSSKEECDQQCKHTIYPVQPNSASQYYIVPENCQLPRDQGPCRKYIPQWFYSTTENECTTFIYGGCEGNQNRFNTRDECQNSCQPRIEDDSDPREGIDSPETVCRLKAETGPCQSTRAMWFYDPDSHTCLPFVYSGCRGNKNRFVNYERCIRFCAGISPSVYPPQLLPQPSPPPQPPYSPSPLNPYTERPVYQPQPSYPQQPQYPRPSESRPQPPQYPYPQPGPSQHECQPIECREEECILGIDYYQDSQGCSACRCTNPCNDVRCDENMSCALELFRDEVTAKIRANAECRLRNKPGMCPRSFSPGQCISQCRSDADCRSADKCCNNGCADVCTSPENESHNSLSYVAVTSPNQVVVRPGNQDRYETYSESSNRKPSIEDFNDEDDEAAPQIGPSHHDTSSAPYNATISTGQDSNEPNVVVRAGDSVVIDCPLLSQQSNGQQSMVAVSAGQSSSPKQNSAVVWSKDGQHIDGVSDRHEIAPNGSLQIRSIDFNDRGTYACMAPVASQENDEISTKIAFTRLVVHVPARILPGPQKVIAQLGLTTYLQCNAVGFPDPKVTWWRGNLMLPLNSLKYRQMQNFTLLIRKIGDKDSGVYTCHAYNGIGPIALWDVTLLLDSKNVEPDIIPYNPGMPQQPLGGQSSYPNEPNVLDRIVTQIEYYPRDYRIGSNLQLNCLVRNHSTGDMVPSANVVWYVNNDVPLLIDATNHHHYQIWPNNTLMVFNLVKADSGEYRCRASTGPQTDAITTIQIQVENVHVPNECQDSPFFANCEVIIKNDYCRNPFYGKFCCRSCYIATHTNQYNQSQNYALQT